MAVLLQTPLVIRDDDDLVRVSEQNPGYRFEREADGAVLVSPTSTNDGAKSGEAFFQLATHAKKHGGRAFDSSTGFAIGPAQTVRSPDASWISEKRVQSLPAAQRTGFWPMSPDVAIEVRSQSDKFDDVIAKTREYLARGTAYAVAIDPQTREVREFGKPPEGLVLDFNAIIDA